MIKVKRRAAVLAYYQSNFKRYEKKYMLDLNDYNSLLQVMQLYMEPDQYGLSTICSLYFDNDDYDMIRESIEKPEYKEKFRLRSYGVPKEGDPVFLEIKKKYKKEVYKRRISLPLNQAEDYLLRGVLPRQQGQIFREIDWLFSRRRLSPKVYLAYDREAYYCHSDPGFRVTFDRDIRWWTESLSLADGDEGYPLLLGEDYRLMEVKALGGMPLWFAKALADQRIFPTSFSKYGTCYKNYLFAMEHKKREGISK